MYDLPTPAGNTGAIITFGLGLMGLLAPSKAALDRHRSEGLVMILCGKTRPNGSGGSEAIQRASVEDARRARA